MARFTLHVNGQDHAVGALDDTPLLWVLRDRLKLTGTKYACDVGVCGACIVYVDGKPMRSCMVPASTVKGKAITTIEGLSSRPGRAVQQAWIDLQVPQCGYCQSGQILTAAALLHDKPNPTDADIDEAMAPVLCRCGTYQRVRAGIHRAAKLMKEKT
ncbi:MAG: (2Fe-2S)-binding protein [Acidiferrobacteraceae bacterium]|jgi:isoquinoline 1-oxidoreductase alpha subunit